MVNRRTTRISLVGTVRPNIPPPNALKYKKEHHLRSLIASNGTAANSASCSLGQVFKFALRVHVLMSDYVCAIVWERLFDESCGYRVYTQTDWPATNLRTSPPSTFPDACCGTVLVAGRSQMYRLLGMNSHAITGCELRKIVCQSLSRCIVQSRRENSRAVPSLKNITQPWCLTIAKFTLVSEWHQPCPPGKYRKGCADDTEGYCFNCEMGSVKKLEGQWNTSCVRCVRHVLQFFLSPCVLVRYGS